MIFKQSKMSNQKMLYFPTSPLYYLAKQENFSLKYMKNTLPINNALNHSSVSYFD